MNYRVFLKSGVELGFVWRKPPTAAERIFEISLYFKLYFFQTEIYHYSAIKFAILE